MTEKSSFYILVFLVCFSPVQDLFLSLLYSIHPNVTLIKSIIYLKEFVVLFGFFVIFKLALNKKLIVPDLFLVAFFLMIFVGSIVGLFLYPIKSVLSEARSFISIFLVYFISRGIENHDLLRRLLKTIIGVGLFIVIFASQNNHLFY